MSADSSVDAIDRLAAMIGGAFGGVPPERAAHAEADARRWRDSLTVDGIGVAAIEEHREWRVNGEAALWMAITDGARAGAILVTLNRRATEAGLNAGEDPFEHLLDRLRHPRWEVAAVTFDDWAQAHPLRL